MELPPPLLCFVGGAAAGIVGEGSAGLQFGMQQRAGPFCFVCVGCLVWFWWLCGQVRQDKVHLLNRWLDDQGAALGAWCLAALIMYSDSTNKKPGGLNP